MKTKGLEHSGRFVSFRPAMTKLQHHSEHNPFDHKEKRTIVLTGATGKLGQLVVKELLERVPASEIVAAVRSIEKVSERAAMGVQIRQADYSQPATFVFSFAGAEKVLLISGNEPVSVWLYHA